MVEQGYQDYADFCQKQIDALARKAEKAKERAAAKKEEASEAKALVAAALTDELQTGAQIFEQVGDEDFTIGKVRAQLTALVRDGSAVKEEVKVEKRTVMAYKLA